MFSYFVFLVVLICKVHCLPCGPVLPPLPTYPLPCPPPPCLPINPCVQVINPNPQVTTIIDNTVSNALVNALQLLLVSNLLGSVSDTAPKPLQNPLGPLLETIVGPSPCEPIEIIVPEFQPCPALEIIPPCSPVVNCGPNIEFIPPYNPNLEFIPAYGPNLEFVPPYGSNFEFISPYGPNFEFIPACGPNFEFLPPPVHGLTEIITPNIITYTETVTPFFGCFESLPPNLCTHPETMYPIYTIEGLPPNYCGGLTEFVTPNYAPITEICPVYGGFEPIPPIALAPMFGGFSEVVAPNLLPFPIFGGLPEGCAFGPLPLTPNYFGGLTEVISQVPLAAELVFPSAFPAQLTCNFGYTPTSLPRVRVNVEPITYEPCNGFANPFYY